MARKPTKGPTKSKRQRFTPEYKHEAVRLSQEGLKSIAGVAADLLEYFADIEPDPTIFFACADRGMNGFNESAYCDSSADADMYASFVTADPNIVRHLLSRVQRRINAAMPTRFLWQGVDVNIVPVRLKHFSDLLGLPFSNVGTWQL